MKTTARLREWGSSIGIVVPSDAIKKEGFKPGDEVIIDIRRAFTLRDLFGMSKGLNLNAQEMKDETRREDARSDAKLNALMNQDKKRQNK